MGEVESRHEMHTYTHKERDTQHTHTKRWTRAHHEEREKSFEREIINSKRKVLKLRYQRGVLGGIKRTLEKN
jgi:hypothetical protein